MDNKVFIAGCGRSGTTYLRVLLDAHSKIHVPLECLFYSDYIKFEKHLPKWIIKYFFFKEPMLNAWYEGGKIDFDNVGDLISKVQEFQAHKEGAEMWGQKTPRFVRFIKEFDNSIPNIKWVLIYRDPRAVVNSLLNSKEHRFSILDAIKRWNNDNKYIVDQLKLNEKSDRIHFVKYEDLVENFLTELNEIFSFLSLNEITLENIKQKEASLTNKMFTGSDKVKTNTVRGGLMPNPKSVDSWKKKLSDEEIHLIQEECEDYMKFFGYDKIPTKTAKSVKSLRKKLYRKALPKEISFLWENIYYYPKYAFMYGIRKLVFSFFKIIKP